MMSLSAGFIACFVICMHLSAASAATVKATCVEQLTLYADGAEIGTHNAKTTAGTFTIPDSTMIVGIKCTTTSTTGSAGIIASFNKEYNGDYITDTTWRCTATTPGSGWTTSSFSDASWAYGASSGNNANPPTGLTTISGVISHARWIWTSKYLLANIDKDQTVYCRGRFGLTRNYDSYGRKFVIGFIENISNNIGNKILLTTLRPTEVTVYCFTPLLANSNANYLEEVRTVVSGGGVESIPPKLAIRTYGSVYNGDKTIVCFATDIVKAVCENRDRATTDLFMNIPVDSLGLETDSTEYYTVSWDKSDTGQRQRFMIVSAYDSTSITITPKSTITVNSVSRSANTPFTVTLNKYRIIQVATSGSTYSDYTSTKVVSTKPVIVYSGNQCTTVKGLDATGGACDHLVEQLTPTSTWGKAFAISPLAYDSDGSKYRIKAQLAWYKITASKASTSITLKNYEGSTLKNTYTYTLNAGGVQKYAHPAGYTAYITSTEGIQVAQLGTSQQSKDCRGDPWMQMIPALNTFDKDYTILPPELTEKSTCASAHFVTVVVKGTDKDDIIVDGYKIGEVNSHKPNVKPLGNFERIGETDYYYRNIEVDVAEHRIRHSSPTVNFGLYYYGYGWYDSYASMGGTRTYPINDPCTTSTGSLGDGKDNDCDGWIDEDDCGTTNDPSKDCAMPSPINGGWSSWAENGDCVCNNGVGKNNWIRTCTNPVPQFNGQACTGTSSEERSCTCTPIDGGWTDWTDWVACSTTCGPGTQSRSRTCTNPHPRYGGAQCTGDASQQQSCNLRPCPIHGGWSNYISVINCTCPKSTTLGKIHQERACNSPPPQHGGNNCSGHATREIVCNCDPVDGGWSAWSPIDNCDCSGVYGAGAGQRQFNRSCDNPVPIHTGRPCNTTEYNETKTDPCDCPTTTTTPMGLDIADVAHQAGENTDSASATVPAAAIGGAVAGAAALGAAAFIVARRFKKKKPEEKNKSKDGGDDTEFGELDEEEMAASSSTAPPSTSANFNKHVNW